MTVVADLAPIDLLGRGLVDCCRAVGWLGRGGHFPRGAADPVFYLRLVELLKNPMQPVGVTPGLHPCDLCQFAPERSGSQLLFVPGSGVLFVCPELIGHYVNAHHYLPPPEFQMATLRCPDMRSIAYMRLFLENGGRELVAAARRA